TGEGQQAEIRDRDVHVDFAGGAHSRRGTPREFLFGRGHGQCDQLARDVAPLSVVALPESFIRILRQQRARAESEQKNYENYFSHDLSPPTSSTAAALRPGPGKTPFYSSWTHENGSFARQIIGQPLWRVCPNRRAQGPYLRTRRATHPPVSAQPTFAPQSFRQRITRRWPAPWRDADPSCPRGRVPER